MIDQDTFVVPILDRYLLYAPLLPLSAVINKQAVSALQKNAWNPKLQADQALTHIFSHLQQTEAPRPERRSGPVQTPCFLGIIPTRGCNMGCRYCDFAAPKADSPQMSLALARAAVGAYVNLLKLNGQHQGEIQFFGGEPFFAEKIVHFVVGYARWLAGREKLDIRFEATTNGLFSAEKCAWIADHFQHCPFSGWA